MKLKIFLIIILLGVLGLVAYVGYTSVESNYSEYQLKAEIYKINVDKISTKLVCEGDYRNVEKAIKSYISLYKENVSDLNDTVATSDLSKLLTYDNLSNNLVIDDTINNLKILKEFFNAELNNIYDMNTENYIDSNIKQYNLDQYYVDLYNELFTDSNLLKKVRINNDDLDKYKEKINNKIDNCILLFEYLKSIPDDYKFEDGEIKFTNEEQLNTYNSYIEKIRA